MWQRLRKLEKELIPNKPTFEQFKRNVSLRTICDIFDLAYNERKLFNEMVESGLSYHDFLRLQLSKLTQEI